MAINKNLSYYLKLRKPLKLTKKNKITKQKAFMAYAHGISKIEIENSTIKLKNLRFLLVFI